MPNKELVSENSKKSINKKSQTKKKAETKSGNLETHIGKKFTKEMKDELEAEIEEFEKETEDFQDEFSSKHDFSIEPESDEIHEPKKRPVTMYRRIAFLFIFLTSILIAAVFYFTFVKLSITIVVKDEIKKENLIIDVYDTNKHVQIDTNKEAISGLVEKVEIGEDEEFQASGENIISSSIIGRVKIINTMNFAQPLIATTRLQSPDNKIFRIKETVTVPANGSVEVDIYTDENTPEMALAPSKFIIPGLRENKQSLVYANNLEAFKYEAVSKKFIQKEDIENAVKTMKASLVKKAEKEFGTTYKGYDKVLYSVDDSSIESATEAKAGEEKDKFIVSLKAKVNVIAFSNDEIAKKAEMIMANNIPNDRELVEFNKKDIKYELNNNDLEQGIATVNAMFDSVLTISRDAELIERQKIAGLNRDQLEDYLESFQEVESFQISFQPSFIERVPNMVDRIEIYIK